jgi:NAD(P)-dependent dehydrogenase (short-subunit alcohol dehydrogenase family)
MNRFEGKVIVTGVGSGPGTGTARRFLQESKANACWRQNFVVAERFVHAIPAKSALRRRNT